MIPLAFINLERRVDRREFVERQLSEQSISSVYRYVAKDARTYKFSSNELEVFSKADFIRDQRIVKPIMCNFLSHYDLWDFMVEKSIPKMIITQDDVVLKPNFASYVYSMSLYLPDDAEVVWLATPEQVSLKHLYFSPVLDRESITPYVSRLEPGVNPCSLCYLITLEGARNLKEQAQEKGVHRATDGWMNDYLIGKRIFYVSSQIVATSNSAFGSDIF
jgi:GR25 family glycosyltransferase involved in LPS biosynthesis